MKERILKFPSGARVIFDSAGPGEERYEGYVLYIWPEDLDECAEFTEEHYRYLLEQIDQRGNK